MLYTSWSSTSAITSPASCHIQPQHKSSSSSPTAIKSAPLYWLYGHVTAPHKLSYYYLTQLIIPWTAIISQLPLLSQESSVCMTCSFLQAASSHLSNCSSPLQIVKHSDQQNIHMNSQRYLMTILMTTCTWWPVKVMPFLLAHIYEMSESICTIFIN